MVWDNCFVMGVPLVIKWANLVKTGFHRDLGFFSLFHLSLLFSPKVFFVDQLVVQGAHQHRRFGIDRVKFPLQDHNLTTNSINMFKFLVLLIVAIIAMTMGFHAVVPKKQMVNTGSFKMEAKNPVCNDDLLDNFAIKRDQNIKPAPKCGFCMGW